MRAAGGDAGTGVFVLHSAKSCAVVSSRLQVPSKGFPHRNVFKFLVPEKLETCSSLQFPAVFQGYSIVCSTAF